MSWASLNPVATSVASATRQWNDNFFGAGDPRSGNFVPDCDFSNPAINNECGVLSNLLFGDQNTRATRYDPDVLTGFGKRQYNWETIAGVQHELTRGLSVNTSYFRRSYGNFWQTDNLAVTPADYDPYCVTMPVDPGLPGGGGNQLCGFYDLSLSKVGQVTNLVTFARSSASRAKSSTAWTSRLPRACRRACSCRAAPAPGGPSGAVP